LADGKTKTSQIVLPWSKVKEILAEVRERPSEEHLGVNETQVLVATPKEQR
jgi:hypothetical protein